MPYKAEAIANYFLALAERDGKQLNPMKIQKLVYYAHGWSLAIRGTPLITEVIQAWEYGPVIPSLYHEFKKFGRSPITEKATTLEIEGTVLRFCTPVVDPSDTETTELLDTIWGTYGDFSGIQLSNLTHEPGSPWQQAYSREPGRKGIEIPDESMKVYFASKS